MDLDYLVVVLPAAIERINQVAKRAGLPGRYAPLLGVAIGVGVCLAFAIQQGHDLVFWTLLGVLAGSATGPWHDVLDRAPLRRKARRQ